MVSVIRVGSLLRSAHIFCAWCIKILNLLPSLLLRKEKRPYLNLEVFCNDQKVFLSFSVDQVGSRESKHSHVKARSLVENHDVKWILSSCLREV